MTITHVHAREILDSRGNPTVEAEVQAGSDVIYEYVPSDFGDRTAGALDYL